MKFNTTMKTVVTVMLLAVAVLSVLVLGKFFSAPSTYTNSLMSLEKKETDVLKLSASAAGVSALITLIPDDVGTPIADQVAEIGSYGLIVICAIYAEKFLLPLTGMLSFQILIPIACVLFVIYLWSGKDFWKRFGAKLAVFAVAIVLVIPASIKVSKLIEDVYSESINQTIQTAEDAQKEMGTVTEITQEIKGVVNRFIQAAAVMLVTSCVIPVLVIILFVWLVKLIFGISFNRSGPPLPPVGPGRGHDRHGHNGHGDGPGDGERLPAPEHA